MKEYHIRDRGDKVWSEVTYSGSDHYEAAEQYAEERDDEGFLSGGNQLIIEIRQYGSEEIKTVAIYADIVVRYNSRDTTVKERE